MEHFVDTSGSARTLRRTTSKWRHSGWLAVVLTASSIALASCAGTDSSNVASEGPATTATAGTAGSGVATSASSLAFSQCMRVNGVPNFPDPGSSGVIPKETTQQLGVSDSVFRSAEDKCQHLLPSGGDAPNQAEMEQVKALGLRFAQCMRRHGVALPDPGSNGRIPDPGSVGINQGSPQFQSANQACSKYRPPYMPSNAAYNAYAGSQGS